MRRGDKVRLSNGFFLEIDPVMPGTFYYYKPGVLMNRISWNTIKNLAENMRAEVTEAAMKLEMGFELNHHS